MKYLLILLGGGAGSLARYLAGAAITNRFGARFPTGTMVVNVTGCFLIGLTMTLLTERLQPHPYWRLVLVVGFLGGYTTFSSFEWETYSAVREGGFWRSPGAAIAAARFKWRLKLKEVSDSIPPREAAFQAAMPPFVGALLIVSQIQNLAVRSRRAAPCR
jgi:CrcB protein